MQRPVSSSRAASDHVIDIMPTQTSTSLSNRRVIWPCPRFRSSRNRCHIIHSIPLVLILSAFILWCFSYPVDLEIKDGRLIAARKKELPPEHVNQTHVNYTILMKKEVVPPSDPSLPPNPTLTNDTSTFPPNPTLMNDTSAQLPIPSD